MLVTAMKAAKDENEQVDGGYISYKSIVLTYKIDDQTVRKRYSLQDVKNNIYWHIYKPDS